MAKNQPKKQTPEAQIDKRLAEFKTWSAKIRYLDAQGFDRGAIAKKLVKRYQHVRNVLETKVTTPKESIS